VSAPVRGWISRDYPFSVKDIVSAPSRMGPVIERILRWILRQCPISIAVAASLRRKSDRCPSRPRCGICRVK
jgi:hypothetical protein